MKVRSILGVMLIFVHILVSVIVFGNIVYRIILVYDRCFLLVCKALLIFQT